MSTENSDQSAAGPMTVADALKIIHDIRQAGEVYEEMTEAGVTPGELAAGFLGDVLDQILERLNMEIYLNDGQIINDGQVIVVERDRQDGGD